MKQAIIIQALLLLFLFSCNGEKDAVESIVSSGIRTPAHIDYKKEASAYLEQQNYEAALNSLKRALEEDPDDPTLYNMKGVVFLGLGQIDSAEKMFMQSLQFDSCYFESLSNLAAINIRKELFPETISSATRAINCANDQPLLYTAYIHRGRAKYHLGKIKEGAADLDSAAKIHPPVKPVTEKIKTDLQQSLKSY